MSHRLTLEGDEVECGGDISVEAAREIRAIFLREMFEMANRPERPALTLHRVPPKEEK